MDEWWCRDRRFGKSEGAGPQWCFFGEGQSQWRLAETGDLARAYVRFDL